jgi:hypothetical protein
MIRTTEHLDLPAPYVCPTCLVSTEYQLGERWQVCAEMHFTKDRDVEFEGKTGRPLVPESSELRTMFIERIEGGEDGRRS